MSQNTFSKLLRRRKTFGLIIFLVIITFILFITTCQCGWQATVHAPLSAEELQVLTDKANQGNAAAQEELGAVYEIGAGVEQSHEEALKWFILSAERGNTKVLDRIAWIYKEGYGSVQPNYEESYFWYALAFAHGVTSVQSRFGAVAEHLNENQKVLLDARAKEWLKTFPK